MSTSSPEAVKKLLENMQTDLRSLSMECKKKFPPVKEVSPLVSFTEPRFLAVCTLCEARFMFLLGFTLKKCMSSFCHSNRGAFELFPYCTSHKLYQLLGLPTLNMFGVMRINRSRFTKTPS